MNIWPLKFRDLGQSGYLVADDAGGFFRSDSAFIDRYASDSLTRPDQDYLAQNGHSFEHIFDTDYLSFAFRWARRQSVKHSLSYVILVPTLRCNLTCGYCQVSRAPNRHRASTGRRKPSKTSSIFLTGWTPHRLKSSSRAASRCYGWTCSTRFEPSVARSSTRRNLSSAPTCRT